MSETTQELVATAAVTVREWDDPLPEVASQKALRRYHAVRDFAKQNLQLGEHFDVLPDEQWKAEGKSTEMVLADPKIKKFFTQAGADMLNLAWGVHSECEIIDKTEQPDTPYFAYTVKVTLLSATGIALGSAIASCSSKESKYAYRWQTAKDIKGNPHLRGLDLDQYRQKFFGQNLKYRVPNMDVADIANTLVQMAEKRAYVKITRRTYGITELFNQPLDEFTSDGKRSGEDVAVDREAVVQALTELGASEAELEEVLGYSIGRLSKAGIAWLESKVAAIHAGEENWADILRSARSLKQRDKPRPSPEEGTLSMDNVRPGNETEHTDVRKPLFDPTPASSSAENSTAAGDPLDQANVKNHLKDRMIAMWPDHSNQDYKAVVDVMWDQTGIGGWLKLKNDKQACEITLDWINLNLEPAVTALRARRGKPEQESMV